MRNQIGAASMMEGAARKRNEIDHGESWGGCFMLLGRQLNWDLKPTDDGF